MVTERDKKMYTPIIPIRKKYTMKKQLLFIFIACVTWFSGISQTYKEALKSLELPVYNFNQKPGNNEKTTKSEYYPDMSSSETRLTNKVFNKITLYYDELNELNIIVYDVISQSVFKGNKSSLLKSFKKLGSAEKTVSDESGIFHVFVNNGNEITLFEPNEKYRTIKPYLKIRPLNNVKVVEKFNESDKTTSIYPINFNEWVNDGDLKYAITFIGYKESKKLTVRVLSQTNNLKQFEKIQIKTDNGEIFTAALSTTQNTIEGTLGNVTQEIGIAELTKEWAKKILNSKATKIKIQGKKSGEVSLSGDITNALKTVYNTLYQ